MPERDSAPEAPPAAVATVASPRWQVAVGAVFIVAAVLGPAWDMATGAGFLADRDIHRWFRPVAHLLQSALRQGRLPLWDPGVACGQPLSGLGPTQLYYPPKWLQLVLGPDAGLNWLALLHPIAGGLGLFALCRRLGRSVPAATLGGLVLAASPLMFATYNVPNLEYACALFPFILWLAFSSAASPLNGTGAAAGLLIGACGLAGAFELMFAAGLVFALVAALESGSPKRVVVPVAVAAVVAGLVALPAALAVLSQSAHSVRGEGFTLAAASRWSLPWGELPDLFIPRAASSEPSRHQPLIEFVYLGAPTLVLALAGFSRRWRLAIPAALVLLLSLGAHGGLFAVLHAVPGAGKLRFPVKFLLAFLPFAGLAVAEGLDALRQPPRWLAPVAAVSVVLVAALGAGRERIVAALAVLAVALVAAARQNSGARLTIVVALAAVDLLAFTGDHDVLLLQPKEDLAAFYAAVPPAELRYRISEDISVAEWQWLATHDDQPIEQNAWSLNFPEVGGARIAGGYGPNVNVRLLEIAASGEGALDLLGVTRVHAMPGRRPGVVEQRLRYTEVVRRSAALPRGFFLAKYEVLPKDEIDRRVTDRSFDPRAAVLLEKAPPFSSGNTGISDVALEEPRSELVKLAVDAPTPGLVVLQDTWDPGWSATLDGAPVEMLRAFGVLRAVAVPAGRHEIVMRYRSKPEEVGLACAGFGLLFAAGCLVADRRRAKAADRHG